jgi:hypothetical protein
MGMDKFKKMAGSSWRESRYIYVISGLQASLYQISEFVSDSMSAIKAILRFIADLQNTRIDFCSRTTVDLSYQRNMLSIKNPNDEATEIEIDPAFLKQRSDIWHALRKKARFTGSTLHSAVGLRGLKEQKRHFRHFFEDEEESFTDEMQK